LTQRLMFYMAGHGVYRQQVVAVRSAGYEGFAFDWGRRLSGWGSKRCTEAVADAQPLSAEAVRVPHTFIDAGGRRLSSLWQASSRRTQSLPCARTSEPTQVPESFRQRPAM